jgi:hypothetical protein
MLMHERLATSSLLMKWKQESPLEVSTCGGPQMLQKEPRGIHFDPIKSWYEDTNEIGTFHTLDRAKKYHHHINITTSNTTTQSTLLMSWATGQYSPPPAQPQEPNQQDQDQMVT